MTQWLRPKDVERIFGIKQGTLAVWRSKGKGPPFYKKGHKIVLYKYEEVEEWLYQQTFQMMVEQHI